ncbi:MAG TPA: tripartite tricarboxylate transporter permease [Beijerinckiaceae bacterium]|nr:tripartite tricarboxylate transporter permease [Beijerinckiaceae bacterium]
MTLLGNLELGFHVALSLKNVLYCFAGAAIGTMVGILPGIGPVTTIAMLLPLTFKMSPIGSLIMLSGIFYGSHHAGSTTAIMLNMPGEPSSVVICLDGHPMAHAGRAGAALFIAAFASFFAGCVGVIIIAGLSPLLAQAAFLFGPAEYTSMIVMALVTASVLSSNALITNMAMSVVGLLLGVVGTDLNTGVLRYTFGFPGLDEGVNFVAVAVGLFAIAEIVTEMGQSERRRPLDTKLRGLLPTKADLQASWKPVLRGTVLGSLFGIMPGTGPLLSSFAAYAMERRLAKDPSRFGKGAIEGVAGPEAANNAAALTHFIPMLTLGIPAGASFALMLGALQIQGITPGPEVVTNHPDLFWGVVASMWIGNLMLLVLNLPMVGLWIRLLMVPYRLLYPAILVFCCIGVYAVSNSVFDVVLAAIFGLVGVVFKKLDCSPAPLILGLVLEPILEEHFRRTILLSRGDFTVFFTQPISLGFLVMTIVLVFLFARRRAPQPQDIAQDAHAAP